MKYLRFFFPFALMLSVLLCGCTSSASTAEILTAMCSSQTVLPAGQVYSMEALSGEDVNTELLAVLYGGGELPAEFAVMNGFDIRLSSFAEPYELAVFRCVSAQDAYDVAQMCLRRIERLRVSCRETEYASLVDSARVGICGKFVLMAICDDPISAIDAGKRVVR